MTERRKCVSCVSFMIITVLYFKCFSKHIFELDVVRSTRCRITPASKNFDNEFTHILNANERKCDAIRIKCRFCTCCQSDFLYSLRLNCSTVDGIGAGLAFFLRHLHHTCRFGECVNISTLTCELIVIWCFPNTVVSFVSS